MEQYYFVFYCDELCIDLECELEYDDARTRPQIHAALDQGERAAIAAGIAAEMLCQMGEYADAYESSPFLPARAPARTH